MGVSTRVKPLLSSQSRIALMIVARTRRMAHCRLERSHRCRLSIRNSTPCSLGAMGNSCDSWTTVRPVTSNSKPPGMPGARSSALTVPVMISDDSRGMRLAASKSSSETLPRKTTAWMTPAPSRTRKNWSLPFPVFKLQPPLQGDGLPDVVGDVFDADDVLT